MQQQRGIREGKGRAHRLGTSCSRRNNTINEVKDGRLVSSITSSAGTLSLSLTPSRAGKQKRGEEMSSSERDERIPDFEAAIFAAFRKSIFFGSGYRTRAGPAVFTAAADACLIVHA